MRQQSHAELFVTVCFYLAPLAIAYATDSPYFAAKYAPEWLFAMSMWWPAIYTATSTAMDTIDNARNPPREAAAEA